MLIMHPLSDRGGKRDLYLMDADGSDVRRAFKFKPKEMRSRPTGSPDGKQIAYAQRNFDIPKFDTYISTLDEQDVSNCSFLGQDNRVPTIDIKAGLGTGC